MSKKISLFIPIYNSKELIIPNVKRSIEALTCSGFSFELFIVDDNSSDKSFEFATEIESMSAGSAYNIRYLFYDFGPSRRENLAKSFFLASADIICFIDADFSCDISFLLEAIEILQEEKADIVVGSRYVKGARVTRRLTRRICSYFYNSTIRYLFGSSIRDHQCGLKVFRKPTIMPLIKEMGYDEAFVRGWFWDAELLIRAQKAGLSIIEMPVCWHYTDKSTFNIRRELRCIKAIAKLKMELK